MAQLDNFMQWCLKKGEEGEKHRGLKVMAPNKKHAKEHVEKAQRYLKVTEYLKSGNYPDIAVIQAFYAMYHSLLAILSNFGYESRNQKCTFACVEYLIEKNKINLDRIWIRKIATYHPEGNQEDIISLREEFQYGRTTDFNAAKLDKIIVDAKELIDLTREIIV